jgi:DNA polymerase I
VYSSTGTPRPTKDPIIIIGMLNNGFHQFTVEDGGERSVIEKFRDTILKLDPDVITGYNTNRFDWPYLLERARLHGIKLDLSRRVGAEPSPSVHGHISVQGRLNVDIYDFAEEVYEVKRKTLEDIAEYFGVMRKDERIIIPWYEMPKYWESSGELRKKLLIYNRHDVESVYKLAEKFLPFGIQLSGLTGIPLDQVMASSVGFRLEFYLMRKAFQHGELVPNRKERGPESYRGAIVLKPKPGVHENVIVLDFTSMYPSIMIKYNVGPDTLVKESECAECYTAPDVGHKFRKDPPGFFKSVLESLLTARREIKQKLKTLEPESPEYNVLNERQRAIKVLANAAYGYMGWQAARWYCKECAEAVTAWGRHNLLTAINKAKDLGLEVIYGDTDSLFVKNDGEKVDEFIKWVENTLGFEIKVDKVYRRVFFTEAKKRYVGLTDKGSIDIVGFEAIRGDWSEIAKELQTEAAKLVLEEGKPDKAISFVRKLVQDMKNHAIPLDKLVIWKTLTKKIEEYEVDAPHVRVAKKYIEQGIKVSPGEKIGYVIVKGPGKISDKAVPYFMAKIEDIDEDYYINHQIIPAALRILQYFGVSEKTLKQVTSEKQKSLFEFLGGK